MRKRRAALDAATRGTMARQTCHHIFDHPVFRSATRIAGYVAIGGELDLKSLLEDAERLCKSVYLPVLQENALSFAPWQPGQAMQANRFGIPEPCTESDRHLTPDALDLVLAPLVAFDLNGNRVGMGGGYYDRSFAFLNRNPRPQRPKLIGVGYQFQCCKQLSPYPWDVKLDAAVTERGWCCFDSDAGDAAPMNSEWEDP